MNIHHAAYEAARAAFDAVTHDATQQFEATYHAATASYRPHTEPDPAARPRQAFRDCLVAITGHTPDLSRRPCGATETIQYITAQAYADRVARQL